MANRRDSENLNKRKSFARGKKEVKPNFTEGELSSAEWVYTFFFSLIIETQCMKVNFNPTFPVSA